MHSDLHALVICVSSPYYETTLLLAFRRDCSDELTLRAVHITKREPITKTPVPKDNSKETNQCNITFVNAKATEQ